VKEAETTKIRAWVLISAVVAFCPGCAKWTQQTFATVDGTAPWRGTGGNTETQPPLRPRFGVNIHPLHEPYNAQRVEQLLDAARTLGASLVRIDIPWAWVETSKAGKWESKTIARLDSFLAQAAVRDIEVLATVMASPCWASADPAKMCTPGFVHYDQRYPPKEANTYADFLADLVKHYKDHIHYWEVWNEPNLPLVWHQLDAGTYAALLRAAYPAIKAADPEAVVLGGALAPWYGSADEVNMLAYLHGIYDAGAENFFDALSIHPYTDGHAPSWYNPRWPLHSYSRVVPTIRKIMREHGDHRPIWITEIGWTTVTKCNDCWTPWLPTTEANQAAYLGQALMIAQRWDYVDAVLVYELVDANTRESPSFDDHFGLLRHDLSLKPSHRAFQDIALPRKAYISTTR